MYDLGDVLREASPNVLSVENCPFYIYQSWDFSSCSLQYIHLNKQSTSDQVTAKRGTVRIPFLGQRKAVEFTLNCALELAVLSSVLTCSYRYIPQDFLLLFHIIVLPFPQQQVMAPQAPQPDVIGSKFELNNWCFIQSGTCCDTAAMHPPLSTLQRCTCSHWTFDPECTFKTLHKTGQSKNKMHYAIECK